METTNTFDKDNNEIFVGDVVIYSDHTKEVLDGIGIVTKEIDSTISIKNVNGLSVSRLKDISSVERHGHSK